MNENQINYKNAARFYDACFSHRKDVAFYVDIVKEVGGGSVLELGCGTGRVTYASIPYAGEIVGLDYSEARIEFANAKLEQFGTDYENLQFIVGDMRDFELGRQFDLVIIPFRGFQHILTREEQKAAFTCIHNHLKPSGRLVFDLFNPSIPLLASDEPFEEFSEGIEIEVEDKKVSLSAKLEGRDYFTQTLAAQEIYHIKSTDGSEEKIILSFRSRYSFKDEVVSLLEICGFDVRHVWGDFMYGEFGESEYPGEIVFDSIRL